MRKVIVTMMFILFVLIVKTFGQQDDKLLDVKFSGYVHWMAAYDSRQIVAVREGHFFLYPKNIQKDAYGRDINATANLNMAAIQSRAGIKVTGPSFLNAKTSAFLEAEFMGNSDADVNGLRIRHAYLTMAWDKFEITAGQTWNLLFNPEVAPQSTGSNGGSPFLAFARNPQLKFGYNTAGFKFSAALLSERDYTSAGPNGNSSEYLRNAVLPIIQTSLSYKCEFLLAGAAAEVKQIKPAIKTSKNYFTDEKVNSFAISGYSKFIINKFSSTFFAIYGGNLTDFTMIGGYAVKSVDTLSMIKKYIPLKTFACYADFSYGKEIEFGLFAGYTKNLGAGEDIKNEIYARGQDIKDVFRFAPRVQFSQGKIKSTLELEMTFADYGNNNSKGEVIDTHQVKNVRIMTSLYYYFN